MNVMLYQTFSEKNKVEKSLRNERTFENVRFIEDGSLSVLSPVLVLNSDNDIINLSKFNYMYIPKFTRYYWINSIETKTSLVYIHGKVDVLMSWSRDILASQQYVLRQQNKYKNPFLQDNQLPIRSDHNYIMTPFGNNVDLKSCGRVILATTGYGGELS